MNFGSFICSNTVLCTTVNFAFHSHYFIFVYVCVCVCVCVFENLQESI